MRWLIAAIVGAVLSFGFCLRAPAQNSNTTAQNGNHPTAQNDDSATQNRNDTATQNRNDTAAQNGNDSARTGFGPPIVAEIAFVGLRRIAPAAVQAQITSHPGALLDSRRIQQDVKKLGRLGWFADIRVETQPAGACTEPDAQSLEPLAARGTGAQEPQLGCGVRLVFRLEEQPYLVRVEYAGSGLLSSSRIEKLLAEKECAPRLGEPADDARLDRAGKAIEGALAELGHPQAHATIQREPSSNGTESVRYGISDGPHLPVGRIEFAGQPGISEHVLQSEMHRTRSGLLASWRGKGAFTPEGFSEDRASLLMYYQSHGYPEARVGNPQTRVYTERSPKWVPRRFSESRERLAVAVPVEAGPQYRVAAVGVSPELTQAAGKRSRKLLRFSQAQAGTTYSVKSIEDLRHGWVAVSAPKHANGVAAGPGDVEATRVLDPDTQTVRVRIAPSESAPYMVRRIEFRGQHRFSDRYLRRRIGLQEGRAFDERALELGLARLTKTSYFRQIHKEDIRVEKDEQTHTVDVTIRIAEAGQQRASLSGGQGQFGSTLGLAYSLFDVLQREELLSAQLDGGPDSLQLMLGLLMEGFLGSRSALAISVFNNVLRPRLRSSVKGPFYRSQSEGLNTSWSYALTQTDSVALNYALAHTNTGYSLSLPASVTGLNGPDLSAKTTSSAVGVTFAHDASDNQFSFANSVSGGALGGTENVLRSNEQYARVFADPVFHRQNAWAFRTTFSGAGSYQGEMPFYARLFSGDAQVRGVSPGELGPYAVVPASSANGNPAYTAVPSGANIITAANAEYRIALRGGAQAAAFFDVGSGWLLPNWLGKTKPLLLGSTNGVLHGSFGLELRWTIPEIQVPVRAYVAINVLRLDRLLQLPDGSLFRAHNKLFSLGWALGNLF